MFINFERDIQVNDRVLVEFYDINIIGTVKKIREVPFNRFSNSTKITISDYLIEVESDTKMLYPYNLAS